MNLPVIPEEDPLNVDAVFMAVANQEEPWGAIRPLDGLIQVLARSPHHRGLPLKKTKCWTTALTSPTSLAREAAEFQLLTKSPSSSCVGGLRASLLPGFPWPPGVQSLVGP